MRASAGKNSSPGRAVHKITAARPSLSEDIRSREIRYGVSMAIRTVCFVLAIVMLLERR